MTLDERDIDQLHLILEYCMRLDNAVARFGNKYNTFCKDECFQDCCCLYLIQIGECVNRLSDEFKAGHPQIEWNNIYGMRCRLVHGYEKFDPEIVWDVIKTYLPPLQEFCKERI